MDKTIALALQAGSTVHEILVTHWRTLTNAGGKKFLSQLSDSEVTTGNHVLHQGFTLSLSKEDALDGFRAVAVTHLFCEIL